MQSTAKPQSNCTRNWCWGTWVQPPHVQELNFINLFHAWVPLSKHYTYTLLFFFFVFFLFPFQTQERKKREDLKGIYFCLLLCAICILLLSLTRWFLQIRSTLVWSVNLSSVFPLTFVSCYEICQYKRFFLEWFSKPTDLVPWKSLLLLFFFFFCCCCSFFVILFSVLLPPT